MTAAGKPGSDEDAAAGIVILGVPIGTTAFIRAHANKKAGQVSERDATFSGARAKVHALRLLGSDTQCRHQLLRRHCAATQCIHLARAVPAQMYVESVGDLEDDIDRELQCILGVPGSAW